MRVETRPGSGLRYASAPRPRWVETGHVHAQSSAPRLAPRGDAPCLLARAPVCGPSWPHCGAADPANGPARAAPCVAAGWPASTAGSGCTLWPSARKRSSSCASSTTKDLGQRKGASDCASNTTAGASAPCGGLKANTALPHTGRSTRCLRVGWRSTTMPRALRSSAGKPFSNCAMSSTVQGWKQPKAGACTQNTRSRKPTGRVTRTAPGSCSVKSSWPRVPSGITKRLSAPCPWAPVPAWRLRRVGFQPARCMVSSSAQAQGARAGSHHSNSTMGWSTDRLSPLAALTSLTMPSAVANSTFSIFMASMTATRSPASTF